MTRLLITGALGHIGSYYVHQLRPQQYARIVLLDNLSTQRTASLLHPPSGVRWEFVEADICTADLLKIFHDIDVVIHLAALTDAANSVERAAEVHTVNCDGTRRVAQACLATGAKLFFPSTTSVYGSQHDVVDETCPHEQLRPQSPYAESKLAAEQLLQTLARDHGLQCCIARLGTIHGPSIGMRFHTAVNKFIWQACWGLPLTVWRTAWEQHRPYLALEDAARAIDCLIEKNCFDGTLYNIVTANHTVCDIVTAIQQHIPTLQIDMVDSPIMNQLSYHVLAKKIAARGFTPTGNLAQNITETIRWLRPELVQT